MSIKSSAFILVTLFLFSAIYSQETKTEINPEIVKLAQSVAGESSSGEEKTRKLVTWINTNFKWSATDYVKRTPEEIIQRRAGNCFELSNVLEVLLKAANIRLRWIAEINIQPRNEERQKTAEQKVSEVGNRMSVFGLRHNDHRWLEVYDEKTKSWIPADPAIGVVGTKEWIAARLAFSNRTIPPVPAVAEIVEDMLFPFAVVALESRRGKPVEDRSEFYLVEGFNKFYGNKLKKLPSWNEWKKLDAQLSPIVSAAFAGEKNLHEQAQLIEQIAGIYEKLKTEASQNKILTSANKTQ